MTAREVPRVSARQALRQHLSSGELLLVPGAYDALSARIIEEAGFPAVYVTGAGFANAAFGLPDIGLVSSTELITHAGRVTAAVSVPVIVDADTGYGGVLQVQRTVAELERAGAAAIQLEDQADPKRCGHFDGQRLIPAQEMVQKIRVAAATRSDSALVLVARTDARGAEGFDAAVARARAYVAAGADVIFVEAPRSADELRALPRLIGAPLLANMVEGGKTPVQGAAQLREAGYAIALYANTALRAAIAAVGQAMATLRADGGSDALAGLIAPWDERQRLVRLAGYQAIEQEFTADRAKGDPA
jgi:2-methylisocitrate lyase-like PEP mutase family enzyme